MNTSLPLVLTPSGPTFDSIAFVLVLCLQCLLWTLNYSQLSQPPHRALLASMWVHWDIMWIEFRSLHSFVSKAIGELISQSFSIGLTAMGSQTVQAGLRMGSTYAQASEQEGIRSIARSDGETHLVSSDGKTVLCAKPFVS